MSGFIDELTSELVRSSFGPVVAMKTPLRGVQERVRREEMERVGIVNFALEATFGIR